MAIYQTKPSKSQPTLNFEPVILENQRRRRRPIDGNDSDSFRCGVCFSDRGKTALRGTIDCCNHTFCFACIVMWASVKSFCPNCELHFTTIRGPSKNVVHASKHVVNVPQQNQAHHVLGNATSGLLNPYQEIRCSVCHGRADESHLRLLCDIYDSAVHTYCVGFRAPAPGAAYFCYDCALSRSNPDKTEVYAAVVNQKTCSKLDLKLPSERSIVPCFGHNHNPSFSSLSTHLSPLFLAGRRTDVDEANGQGERWHPLSAPLCGKRSGAGRTKEG